MVVFVLHRICLEEVSCCQVANWVHQKKGHLGCETKHLVIKHHTDAVQKSIEQARSVRVSFISTVAFASHTRQRGSPEVSLSLCSHSSRVATLCDDEVHGAYWIIKRGLTQSY